MNNIILCSTLTDPKGVFLEDIEEAVPTILETYKAWVVNASEGTDERIKKSLQEKGAIVVEAKRRLVPNEIEADHLNALVHGERVAGEEGVSKIQYMDGDRVLMAATYFPEAFKEMAQRVDENLKEKESYLNIRRSPEDYFTHHSPLVETELEFNRLYSKILGIPLDVGGTIHGFSREVVEGIINRSPKMRRVTFPHSKWLLIARETATHFGSIEAPRVGSFETPQQYKAEVAERLNLKLSDLAKYETLQQAYMGTLGKESTVSPAEWERRFELFRQYIDVLEAELPNLGLSRLEQEAAKVSIEKSRVFMRGKERITTLPPETRAEWVKEELERAKERWEKEKGKKWQSSLESKE